MELLQDEMELLQDDLKDATRRWLVIRTTDFTTTVISQHGALFLVAKLKAILLEELASAAAAINNADSNKTNKNRTTGLYLYANCLSEQAVAVFCDYFQQEDIHLPALYLVHPTAALLNALHHNTSIKDLCIQAAFDEDGDDTMGRCIGQMLQHKNDDFESLYFVGVSGFDSKITSHALPFLGGKHPHLKKLGFVDCVLYDDDIELAIRGMLRGGDYSNLRELSFANNELESPSLHWFSALDSTKFPCLETLDVHANPALLQDKDITSHFVQQVVSADGTALKELNASFCSDKNQGHPTVIIKALANRNTRLVSLDLTCWRDDDLFDRQAIRNELVESLPNMKNIQHLKFNEQVFDNNDQELITAFSKNTSILKLSSNDREEPCTAPRFVAILKRNDMMAHVFQMLGLGTTATTTTTERDMPPPIPSSLWPRVLEKVGQGSYGSSPAFMILQSRLASWPESSIIKSNNKRKRNES